MLEATDSRRFNDYAVSVHFCRDPPHLWVTASPQNLVYRGYKGNKKTQGPAQLKRSFPDLNSMLIRMGPFFWGYQVVIRVKVFALVKSLLGVAGETSDRRVPLINARRARPLMGMWTNSRKAFGPTLRRLSIGSLCTLHRPTRECQWALKSLPEKRQC